MQLDGYETEDGFIIRLYDSNNQTDLYQVWVYWPNGCSKVTFYLNTIDEALKLFKALKAIRPETELT